jgi:hypothetical protein
LTAWPDIDAVYDHNDNLHVIWNTFIMTDTLIREFVFHYDVASQAINEIVRLEGPWPPSGCDWGVWNLAASKMSIGSNSSSALFVTYTRFFDDDCSAGGYANGEIFAQYSADGAQWSTPVDLTNSPSPGCLAGDCDSDVWPSLAERVDDNLHILYVNDKDAGGIPQSEGELTDNPMLYYRVPVEVVGVADDVQKPKGFTLGQNFPNPFNSTTIIPFELEEPARVKLSVYDITGALIRVLSHRIYDAGRHRIAFNVADLPSGIYFYKIDIGGKSLYRKMTLIK